MFENKHRDELIDSWNEYKLKKLNAYLQTRKDTQPREHISFEHLEDEHLSQAMSQVSEIASLIDVVHASDNLVELSPDHLAFEYFDFAVHSDDLEYTKYEDDLHKEIYGADSYTDGYQNARAMADAHEDIYDLDDPGYKGQLFRRSAKTFRDVLENRRHARR